MVPRKGIPQGLCVSSQGSRRSQGVWEKWQRLVSALEIRALQQRGRCWAGKGEQRSLWERFGERIWACLGGTKKPIFRALIVKVRVAIIVQLQALMGWEGLHCE